MNQTTQSTIPLPRLLASSFCKAYENMNFDALLDGFNHACSDYSLDRNGIIFQENVGPLMTGEALLYYPELAKKLCDINDYPVLKRCYKVDRTIKGISFLKYFCQYLPECFNTFQAELEALSTRVNHLFHLHSQEPLTPLIDHLELVKERKIYPDREYIVSQILVIHGIKWPVTQERYMVPQGCMERKQYIDLHRLLDLSTHDVKYFFIEDFVVGTPFIQVRLAKTFWHKGHTKWYSLDTRQPVSKAEVTRWKKPT